MNLVEKEKSEKAIKAFSFKILKRAFAAGDRSLTLEDIQQELRLVWVIASRNFNPESGVPFQAYLLNGMKMYGNRFMEKNVNRRHAEVCALSLDGTPTGAPGGDEGEMTLGDAIADETAETGADFEADQHFAHVTKRLSDRARIFITILREQPTELLDQVTLLAKKSEYARREMGVTIPVINRLAASTVFDLMGATRFERHTIVREIRALGEQICETAAQ